MNERIKELLNKASRYAYEQNPGENSYGRPVDENKYNQDRDTKFAELLVVKCANIVWDEAHKTDNAEINDVGYKILEHFGVEE